MRKNILLFVMSFAILIMLPFKVNAMQLDTYNYKGEFKTIEVESSDTIEVVKQKIGIKTGKTAEDTILVFNGQELENGRTVADYSIKTTDVVYMLGDIYFTLNSNGGFFKGLSSEKSEYIVPKYYSSLIEPQRDGYTFKGWYTKIIGGYYSEYYFDEFAIEESKKFYAHWDKKGIVTINFTIMENALNMPQKDIDCLVYLISNGKLVLNQNNGEVKNEDGKLLITLDVNSGNITFADNLTSKDNMEYILSNSERKELKDNGMDDVPEKIEIIFSANDTHKVIFDANGGIFSDNKNILTIEEWKNEYEESLEKPVRDGYKFKGYYTQKTDGTRFEMILNESGIDSDMIFYAQWELDEDVPKTFDNIESSIFIGTISLIGLVGVTIYLKRKAKKSY